ncbi:MAG: tRNA (adenosine(37)-N6)-threonylcarbamoyltransferase complex ATPase subunit type 1 TsaE [Trueperaceae bacterium]|nr:tRNA (adenosine(37)-N6)-threonylcarbamoyltransferase complex ATPase subunit type 1 TsaE [Trueperaceae bacterium]
MDLPDLAATRALALRTAAVLPRGQLLIVSGPLGAGKTTFVAALAAALGSDADVTSPTYTLVHEYPTPAGPLVHVDAYRLAASADVAAALDLEAYLDRARAVVVEWGERLLAAHPEAWHLRLTRDGERRAAHWDPDRGPA